MVTPPLQHPGSAPGILYTCILRPTLNTSKLAELEKCIAFDYQSHTITNSIVQIILGVDQMDGLSAAVPASTDVNSLA